MTEKRRYCPRNHDTFQVGRDSSYRCLQCKREASRGTRYLRIAEQNGIREAERRRQYEEQQAARETEHLRSREELDRRQEQKYQAAIRRGGYDAAMARWDRAYSEAVEKGRYGLCQWEDDDAEGRSIGRMCYRRTSDVYCWRHNAQLDRETARQRKAATSETEETSERRKR